MLLNSKQADSFLNKIHIIDIHKYRHHSLIETKDVNGAFHSVMRWWSYMHKFAPLTNMEHDSDKH